MLPPPSDSFAKLGFLERLGEAIVTVSSVNQFFKVVLLVPQQRQLFDLQQLSLRSKCGQQQSRALDQAALRCVMLQFRRRYEANIAKSLTSHKVTCVDGSKQKELPLSPSQTLTCPSRLKTSSSTRCGHRVELNWIQNCAKKHVLLKTTPGNGKRARNTLGDDRI